MTLRCLSELVSVDSIRYVVHGCLSFTIARLASAETVESKSTEKGEEKDKLRKASYQVWEQTFECKNLVKVFKTGLK
jgi:hypothetical protein